ncbi:30S ribosomal protein S21 [Candidatus Dojkabacteria bacterium]|uniref:Small ribosomal subunit protein bS21 n=1 Tax=Candidatus Dojkabacteria bacterium TaxID=2099670 RepID=A0A955LA29_9BACT|nr:30S ribosomal protein S21 [Candidatus Dojkabacteria bacterium]
MSVIVNNKMPIDLALRLLWREATREGIIQTLKDKRYFVPKTTKKHAVRKVYTKMKRRRRAAARRSN